MESSALPPRASPSPRLRGRAGHVVRWLVAYRPLDVLVVLAGVVLLTWGSQVMPDGLQCATSSDAELDQWRRGADLLALGGLAWLGGGALALVCRRSWLTRIVVFLAAVVVGAVALANAAFSPCTGF